MFFSPLVLTSALYFIPDYLTAWIFWKHLNFGAPFYPLPTAPICQMLDSMIYLFLFLPDYDLFVSIFPSIHGTPIVLSQGHEISVYLKSTESSTEKIYNKTLRNY